MERILKSAWREYVRTGQVGSFSVRPLILESWKRCLKKGIDPYQKKVPRVLSKEELKNRRLLNQELISTCRPVMESIYNFVKGSGFIVGLADKEGYILEIIGDDEVAEIARDGNFVAGADWSEDSAGTNAIGTSLTKDIPIQVFSYEHFCICSHNWTCSAATIHDPEGKVIGVLDVTGTQEKVHCHTLGMVVAAAKAVENQLSLQRAFRTCQIADSYKNTIIESIAEGVMAFDPEGVVTHVNDVVVKLLELDKQNILGKMISDIWGEENVTLQKIIRQGKEVTDYEMEVSTGSGKRLSCNLTCRPIIGRNKNQEGTVLIINEIVRTRRLVQRMVGAQAKFTFKDLVGRNKQFLATIRMGKAAAGSTSNVLLLGESGTGKDMFAQAIHNESDGKKGPFVAINCGAIPRELIASELFGYTDGAFTGAKRGGNPGKFELADGGTIFLDEIGEMPLELQTMLLRVLEQKTIVRIGGQEVIPVDVRIIAATNKDLLSEIRKGNFRKDLFYRLNVISITMLPLRERKDDITLLLYHFLEKLNSQLGKNIAHIHSEVEEVFRKYSWPGNVRELQNVLERAVNMATGSTLSLDLIPSEIYLTKESKESLPLEQYEQEIVKKLLVQFDGNISRVAEELGVARTTIYRKINKYGIKVNCQDVQSVV